MTYFHKKKTAPSCLCMVCNGIFRSSQFRVAPSLCFKARLSDFHKKDFALSLISEMTYFCERFEPRE